MWRRAVFSTGLSTTGKGWEKVKKSIFYRVSEGTLESFLVRFRGVSVLHCHGVLSFFVLFFAEQCVKVISSPLWRCMIVKYCKCQAAKLPPHIVHRPPNWTDILLRSRSAVHSPSGHAPLLHTPIWKDAKMLVQEFQYARHISVRI